MPVETAMENGVQYAWWQNILVAGHDVVELVGIGFFDVAKCQTGELDADVHGEFKSGRRMHTLTPYSQGGAAERWEFGL